MKNSIILILVLVVGACSNTTTTDNVAASDAAVSVADAKPGDPSPTCNFLNCDGCCAGTQCITATSDNRCGLSGSACVACVGAGECIAGSCVEPTPCEDCDGCCWEGTTCLTGASRLACGSDGDSCTACPDGQGCSDAVCQVIACDASNCDGCCTANGDCVATDKQNTTACGKAGNACNVCEPAAESCTLGTCVVGQACLDFCDDGCCTDQGQCILFADQDADTCGAEATCAPCSDELSCLSGACTANPVWAIEVRSAVLSATDSEGEDWDQALFTNPLPDAYVIGALGNAVSLDWATETIDNTITPDWNETTGSYLQGALLAEGLKLDVRDSDGLGVFETMGSCTVAITMADLLAGSILLTQCGSSVSNLRLAFHPQ